MKRAAARAGSVAEVEAKAEAETAAATAKAWETHAQQQHTQNNVTNKSELAAIESRLGRHV